jgi:MFS family permease
MADDRSLANGQRPGRSRTFAALSHPGFRLYYVGQGISLIGTWLQAAAVRWIVFDQTGSEFLLGVVEVANLMPGMLVGLFAGALADRVAPRTMILAMETVQMVLALLLAVLVGLGVVQFWQMVLILALTRISATFEQPSRQVFFFDLVGKETLPNAIALNSGLFNATRVIGPALAGVGLAVLGATGCFSLNGLSYLAAIAAVYFIRLPHKERPAQRPGIGLKELMGGLSYIRHDRRILAHFLLMAFFGFIGMGYEAMIPAYTRRIVATDVEGYSLILAFGGLGATAGALTMARLGRIERNDWLVIAGILVFAASLATAAFFPYWVAPGWPGVIRVAAASACILGAGFGASLFYSSTQTLIQLAVPHHLRGRVIGVWMIVFSGSVPLGALWTGRAALPLGVTPVMCFSALACAGMSLLVLASGVLKSRRDPPGPVIADEPAQEAPPVPVPVSPLEPEPGPEQEPG